jgi:PucR family transcriptional regulator, purine catabolism regulatory protein
MPLPLTRIFDHPALQAAAPVLRAGSSAARSAQVRWVHSSEVLDIAPLLRGGELLLTGGTALAHTEPQQRRHYVTELAERGVAALAIETGGPLPTLPADVVRAADEAGLPLIELRAVVPFVGVAEAINSLLVNESVAVLQRADTLSHTMAAELAHGGGLDELLGLLAADVPAAASLIDPSGEVFASSTPLAPEREGREGDGHESTTPARSLDFDVSVRGLVTATLRLELGPNGDAALARVVAERAVDILSLALLKRQQPSLREVAGAELLRAVIGGAHGERLLQLCGAAGIDPKRPVVVVAGRMLGASLRAGAVEQLLRRRARHVVTYVSHHELVALVSLPESGTSASRAELLAELSEAPADSALVCALGPVAPGIGLAARSLSEAQLTFDLARGELKPGAVLDAEALALERLAARQLSETAVRNFVQEQVSELLEHDATKGSRLAETLDVWLTSGCNTAESARTLHLERQSMHNRLQRIFELIGGDPRGTERLAGLHMAVRLGRRGSYGPTWRST